MRSTIKWHKELIECKWFSVADIEHVPMIEHCKDGSYKVRNCNGKAIIHKEFSDAVKLAIKPTRSSANSISGLMEIRVSKMRESTKAYLSGVGKRLKGLSEVLLDMTVPVAVEAAIE